MTATNDPISDGRAAWQRIKTNSRTAWSDWVLIARCLEVARCEVLKIALTSSPVGSRYNAEMGRWLREHDLADVPAQTRYRCLQILKNLPAIEAWRESLSDTHRRRFNHPNCVWNHWQKSMIKPNEGAPARSGHQDVVQKVSEAAAAARKGLRPVYWNQSAVRRSHEAMLASRSSDLLVLARLALEAAIRTEADLLALLEDRPPPAFRPKGSHAATLPLEHA
jgi:hypothetical protein